MRGPGLFLCALCLLVAAARPLTAADDKLATVEGTVTYKGQPLKDATITFHLKNGQFVGAKIKDDGKYRVDRVPVGIVKATLQSRSIKLPPKVTSEEASALTLEIKEGKMMANIELGE